MKRSVIAAIIMLFSIIVSPADLSAKSSARADDTSGEVLPEFSFIKIEDVTVGHANHSMYGYPGIWIKGSNTSWSTISYSKICEPYISKEVVNDTLIVKVDLSFLNPLISKWNSRDGMIEAITISCPKKSLKAVSNYGNYRLNMSLIDIKSKSLMLTSSNTTYFTGCNIGSLSWQPVEGRSLAEGCEYNVSVANSTIGRFVLSAYYLAPFRLNYLPGSKIGSMEQGK